jgi:hypothetical protein
VTRANLGSAVDNSLMSLHQAAAGTMSGPVGHETTVGSKPALDVCSGQGTACFPVEGVRYGHDTRMRRRNHVQHGIDDDFRDIFLGARWQRRKHGIGIIFANSISSPKRTPQRDRISQIHLEILAEVGRQHDRRDVGKTRRPPYSNNQSLARVALKAGCVIDRECVRICIQVFLAVNKLNKRIKPVCASYRIVVILQLNVFGFCDIERRPQVWGVRVERIGARGTTSIERYLPINIRQQRQFFVQAWWNRVYAFVHRAIEGQIFIKIRYEKFRYHLITNELRTLDGVGR